MKGLLAIACLLATDVARADARDELLIIVNPANDAEPNQSALENIFLRKSMDWPNGERAIPINAPPDADRRRLFDRLVLAMSPDEAARYWLDLRIRGGGSAPREVADIVLTVKLVAKLKGAVGYVPGDATVAGVRIVARVRANKVVSP